MQESHSRSADKSEEKRFSWLNWASRAFGGKPVNEAVRTRVLFNGSPAMVWGEIAFYEEIPGRAPFPLSLFMPIPLRAEGAKSKVGAVVRCIYNTGELRKRMTAIEAPNLLKFEVLEQNVGIEDCAVAERGSYEIQPNGDRSDVVLTTHYRAYLHPRWFWRPIEMIVTHQLHRHVLNGMRSGLSGTTATVPAPTRSL